MSSPRNPKEAEQRVVFIGQIKALCIKLEVDLTCSAGDGQYNREGELGLMTPPQLRPLNQRLAVFTVGAHYPDVRTSPSGAVVEAIRNARQSRMSEEQRWFEGVPPARMDV